jgi:hypothetical protein
MATNSRFLSISSLSGGVNDFAPPLSLPDDECTQAENVEFFYSALGERRLGCIGISLPVSITADANIQSVTWLGKHLPTNTQGDAELWALGQHLTAANNVLTRRAQTVWSTVTPTDAITVTNGLGHKLSGTSCHGKFFLGYKSGQDRLHVWDGTTLRRAGLAAPTAAPTAVETGVAGAFASTRYYRVRYAVLSGATVLLRSEPSAVLTFTPTGTKTGAVVTKPATINEGETHWELEASTDNAVFYLLARQVVGTTTFTDTTAFATGYVAGTLSETITSYSVIPSGKFTGVDQDRLLIAGSWENSLYASRLWWTPVFGSTGTGNDERLDMTVNPYLDLDGFEGGEITGLSRSLNGFFYVFKFGHIYKLVRSGVRTAAYNAVPITKSRGALTGSIVEAVDEAGAPALYFLDPKVGPMRIGENGLEWCGSYIRNLWTRVNQNATVPAHGVFYQAKNQIHFWVALDGADHPNAKIVLHCDQIKSTPNGAIKGWATVPTGDRISDAHCSIMFSNNVDSTDPRNQLLVPFIGKEQWTVGVSTIKNLIQQCDTGTTDAYTPGDDVNAIYYASVITKEYLPAGLLGSCGVLSAGIALDALPDAENDVYVKGDVNFGRDSITIPVSFISEKGETVSIKELDNFSLGEAKAIQISLGDLDTNITPTATWKIQYFTMKLRTEQTA